VVPDDAPICSPLVHFGHTLGASGLLSVALAALSSRGPAALDVAGGHRATDGRSIRAGEGTALVACRALGGACVAVGVSTAGAGPVTVDRPGFGERSSPPLRIPILRRIAAEAESRRPAVPPAAVVVCLDRPLVPPTDARVGGRLLPSVVLEITPGFIGQLVARSWGYRGPVVTLVGGNAASDALPTLTAIRSAHGNASVLHVHGDDVVEWGT
jgi:hypothetical protein